MRRAARDSRAIVLCRSFKPGPVPAPAGAVGMDAGLFGLAGGSPEPAGSAWCIVRGATNRRPGACSSTRYGSHRKPSGFP